jgi:hypothetical protein
MVAKPKKWVNRIPAAYTPGKSPFTAENTENAEIKA